MMKDLNKKHNEAVFELQHVRFLYPDGVLGVEVEELFIPGGVCTILLGPNGSGKSTLLKILDGLIFPQEGKVTTFGEMLSEKHLSDRRFRRFFRGNVGFVFQDADIQCFSPSVREELAFGPIQKGLNNDEVNRRVEEAMRILHIDSIAERYPYRLSGGEKKRVAIASVLTIDPNVYLLDEPTANLDPATEGILIDLLADFTAQDKTLVVATQDLLLARHIGSRAVVLGTERKPLAAGPIDEILERDDLLASVGLTHSHRHPHRKARVGFRHTHYTEEDNE